MKDLSVVIYTRDEEKNIKDCIKSAMLLSDDIIVIDMESRDRTATIASDLGSSVFNFPPANYVEPAREFGIKQAQTHWVLVLDADERISEELSKEIKLAIKDAQFSNYKIRRKNIFGKLKWLRFGGWWPDYQTRLINKKYFFNWPKRIHSTPKIKGETGYLKNPLIHYFHGDLEKMVNKTVIFENIESDLLYKAGKTANTPTFFRKYLAELWRRMIKNLGFLDGTTGVIESIYQAFSKTITYLFLYEKRHKSKSL